MTDQTHVTRLPAFSPALPGFRAEEFLRLTEQLLAVPIEQDAARLDLQPFRLDAPEPQPEGPIAPLPPRWYPRPSPQVIEAARAALAPPPRPAILAGRKVEMERVLRPLLSGHPMIVRGEPGVGKTTLLAAIALHERTRVRFRRIWWFDQPARLEQTLALALDMPHLLAVDDPGTRRARLSERLDENTLLIVDNTVPGDPVREVLALLTDHVLLAVETPPEVPDPDEPIPDDPPDTVTLRALDDDAAIDALAFHAAIEDPRRLRGDLGRIALALGKLPYALMLAGRLMSRDGLSLAELEEALAAEDDRSAVPPPEAESAEPEAATDEPDVDAEPENPTVASLNRALGVSVAALPRDYQVLFEAFGSFPASGAPFDGLHAAAHFGAPLATRRGLIALAEYGFIRRDHRDPQLHTMHPVAHARALASEKKPALDKRVRIWALQFARAHLQDPLALYRAEPALLHVHQSVADRGPNPLFDALRGYLREYQPDALHGDPQATLPEINGPRTESASLTSTGLELTDRGAAYAAEEALKRALEIRQATDSPHAVAETLVALARLHDANGRSAQAAEALITAAELLYKLGAAESLSVVRRGLARVYRHMGRLTDALEVLDDAPSAHLERALILKAQGRYSAAVAEMEQAPEATPYARAELYLLARQHARALEAIAGQDDVESILLRAQIHLQRGDTAQALEGYKAALDCGAEDGAIRARILRGYGAALASDGQTAAARDRLEAALALQREDPAPDPLRLGRTLRLLAGVVSLSGDDAGSVEIAREAVGHLKQVDAPADTADAYRTIGRALLRQGDADGALEAFTNEVEYAQSVTERDENRIAMALYHLADAYRLTGSLDRAVANYRLALGHFNPVAEPAAHFIAQLALHRALVEQERLSAALDVAQELVDQLAATVNPDLRLYGYAQAIRARTQQAMDRPIRAQFSIAEWAQALTFRAPEAVGDPRPAIRTLVLGLAARSLLADNRPALALDLAEHNLALASEVFPETLAAWAASRDLGEAYMALDRAEEAIITLEPLLSDAVRDAEPATYARAHRLTGEGYHAIGDAEMALRHLRAAVEHEPDETHAGSIQETIAAILLEEGQPADAVESLRAALPLVSREDQPDIAARILTTLAHTLGGLNRYAEAIGVYEEALVVLRDVEGVSPVHTADVLCSLGQTHEAQGQLPEAARVYRRALNVLERAEAPHQTRAILHRLARALASLGDANAVQVYEQTREETEKWGDAQQLGQVLCELANVHRDAGRVMAAVQHYQAALEHQPAQLMAHDRANTLRNLGRAYAQAERYDEARAVWTEALELSAEQPDQSPVEIALTHHAIAEAHRSQGHYHDAELSYREALNHHTPRTVAAAETWRALGRTLREAGRFEEAIDPLRKALEAEKAQPQQANARLVQTLQLLAETQEDCGDVEAAIARHHEALVYMDRALQPVAYAETLRTLGGLYAELGNYEQAHVALEEALEIETAHVPRSDERISATLQAIADTYRSAGHLEQAAVYYQKVTVYTNLARRASDDLRSTLDELERRRGTLQAAQQSLALLDRHENTSVKDLAFIHALIAHSHAQLNQPQASADQIATLLDILVERRDELDSHDVDPDRRALAWLAEARQAETEGDPEAVHAACASALEAARNTNLRWVIEQVIDAIE